MRVLVVDDNIAIQEILKDILKEEGHSVKIAGTIEDAVDTIVDFRPEAILLDTLIDDEDGLQVLVKAHERNQDIQLNAILIKGMNDESPHDNSYIKGVVNKPFKSSDISAALSALISQKEEEAKNSKKNGKLFPKLFGGKRSKKTRDQQEHIAVDDTAIVAEYIASDAPMYGRSYVFFEKEPNKIYDFINIFDPSEYSVLVITSDNAKATKQHFGTDSLEVATLSATGKGKTMNINALGTLTVFIKQYAQDHHKPLVMIENFSDIIDSNGLNHSLVFIHQLINSKIENKTVSYVVSVDPSIMTTKDRNILLGDMSEYSN